MLYACILSINKQATSTFITKNHTKSFKIGATWHTDSRYLNNKRLDKGFSFPKVDDWFKLKEILEFDETYDILMNQYILVPDRQEQIAKLGLKSVEILPKHRYIYFTDNQRIKQTMNYGVFNS